MSPLLGILLAAFLTMDLVIVVACVIHASNRHERMRSDRSRRAGAATESLGVAMVVQFAFAWSAFTLFFDYAMYARDAVKQWRTQAYVSVPGEVVRCRILTKVDGDETTRNLDVEYTYRVDNHEYRATVVRHLNHWSRHSQEAFVAAHPPGTRVAVFHDPDNSADAVLLAGIGGTELIVPLCLLPFNLVMLAFWCAGVAYAWGGKKSYLKLSAGVRFSESRVRLPLRAPLVGATWTMGIAAIPVVLAVYFVAGIPASVSAALAGWGIVLSSGLLVYLHRARQAASGKFDLVVDQFRSTLTLPQSSENAAPIVVRLADLTGIEIAVTTKDEECTRFSPTVHWQDSDGQARAARLGMLSDEDLAQELTAWLHETVGVRALPSGGRDAG